MLTEEQIKAAIKILKSRKHDDLAEAVKTIQQQNKQLIAVLGKIQEQVFLHSSGYALNVYNLCEAALQQIQGKET